MSLNHGPQSHHGLSGTYISLEQAVHAVGCGHVSGNLVHHHTLRIGEHKRQGLLDPPPNRTISRTREASVFFHRGMARAEDELDSKKDIPHELASGLLALGHIQREVNGPPDIRQKGHPSPPLWPKTGNGAQIGFLKSIVDEFAQNMDRQAIPRAVHGRDAVEVQRDPAFVLNDLEFRMFDHQALRTLAGLAVNDKTMTTENHFLHPGHIIPAEGDGIAQDASIVILENRLKNPAWAEAFIARLLNHAIEAEGRLRGTIRKAVELPAVLVAPWKMAQQILKREQPQAPQSSHATGWNPG